MSDRMDRNEVESYNSGEHGWPNDPDEDDDDQQEAEGLMIKALQHEQISLLETLLYLAEIEEGAAWRERVEMGTEYYDGIWAYKHSYLMNLRERLEAARADAN